MTKEAKAIYSNIDIAKFIACICVIVIHTGPLADANGNLKWWIYAALVELAVPFFFVSSGFFLGKKIYMNTKPVRDIVRGYILRLFKPYLFFSIINIVQNIVLMVHNGKNGKEIVISVVKSIIFYPYGGLWYVWACIVAVILLYPFVKHKRLKAAIGVGSVMYGFGLLCDSYNFVIEDTFTQEIVETYIDVFQSHKNGLLIGFVFMGLGIKCAEIWCKKEFDYKKIVIVLLVTYTLSLVEKVFLRSINGTNDYVISYLILIPSLLLVLANIKNVISSKNSLLLRNLSVGMYFVHRPVVFFVEIIISDYFVRFACVTFISFLTCLIVYKTKPPFIYELLK